MLAKKKEEYREYYLNIRKGLSLDEVKEKSKTICGIVHSFPIWERAQTVMLYAPTQNEVDVTSLIKAALEEGKNLLLPRVEHKIDIVPYKIRNFPEDLAPGFASILEPIPGKTIPWEGEINIIVVPGVVFDIRGGRIGYGLGCYDRFLKKHPKAIKIGLTFERCLTYALPLESEDEMLDIVITEEHTFKTEKGKHLYI